MTALRASVLRTSALLAALLLSGAFGVGAQESTAGDSTLAPLRADQVPVAYPPEGLEADPSAMPLSFGPGERLVYKVKIGWFGAGEGELTLRGVDSIRGHTAYRGYMHVRGSFMGFGVNDHYHSWFDVGTMQSWRFIRDINSTGYSSYRHYEMVPARRAWERQDNDEYGTLGSLIPLDDIAFMYHMRDLPLVPGETYTVDRYFKEDGNPIRVEVLRYDERETEGVRYQTVVVRPRVKTDGLFGEDGEAEIHLTRDEFHYPVYMKFDMPILPGSLTLHLRSIEEGLPLNPEARADVLAKRAEQGGSPEGR